jgi:hypothetical protein
MIVSIDFQPLVHGSNDTGPECALCDHDIEDFLIRQWQPDCLHVV